MDITQSIEMTNYSEINETGLNNSTQIPEYDYEIVHSPPTEELVPVSIAYGTTLVLGVAGNGLVIFSVSRYHQMMTITNTFLLSLASADLLLLLVCVPVKFAAFFSYNWRFGEFLCKSVHYVQNVSAICSVATLTFMSLERYYAIVHPLRSKYVCTTRRARRMIICLWIASFVLAVPILLGRVHITVGSQRKATWCVKWFKSVLVGRVYEIYMFCIILLIPVIVMSFAYFRICDELWCMTKDRMELRAEASLRVSSERNSPYSTPVRQSHSEKTPVLKVKVSDDDSTKKQVVKMLVAVVSVFILCWAPILINNILVSFAILPELHVPPYKYMREAFHLMSYANSCVNPIVYGFMSRNFRQTFKRALCSCIRGRQYMRRMNFRNQRWTINEKWNVNNSTRQCELTSTCIMEMSDVTTQKTHGVTCLDENGKIVMQ